jgi:hypothetical protein
MRKGPIWIIDVPRKPWTQSVKVGGRGHHTGAGSSNRIHFYAGAASPLNWHEKRRVRIAPAVHHSGILAVSQLGERVPGYFDSA